VRLDEGADLARTTPDIEQPCPPGEASDAPLNERAVEVDRIELIAKLCRVVLGSRRVRVGDGADVERHDLMMTDGSGNRSGDRAAIVRARHERRAEPSLSRARGRQ